MELRDYLHAIRKRWWLVVGAVVVAFAVATLVTARTPPRYAASVTFFVSTPTTGVTDAYQGGLFSQQRVRSYADLLTSDRLARAIVDGQPLGLTAEQVQASISARAVPDTVLVEATVTDGSRTRALRLIQALATEFTALVQALETPAGSSAPTVRVEVVAGPRLGSAPVSPQPLRNLVLATVLGLLAGMGAAVLREVLDTTVKTAAALYDLASAPVLSSVPLDASAKKAPLIIEGSARSARAEALRQLRTNLQFVNVDEPVKTIVVTSAVPGEGKSTTACNLAIVFAEAGNRVVLVDADLRRPRLADYLGLEGAIGLTNVLAGQTKVDDALQQWGGGGLWMLPSGSIPPNPSELLGSRNMADLLEALKDGFDIIIIDTPPLLPVTDAAVAAAHADGAVLVTHCGRTSDAQVKAAVTALEAVGASLLGCVLNMVATGVTDAYSYYEYGQPPTPQRTRPAPYDLARDPLPTLDAVHRAEASMAATAGGGARVKAPRRGRP